MLIATAGHIDHGKSALVRALTGAETDRLPEEKARGISIDLGFAYWRPDAGETIGFVDVPGHERFVRNMIAGLSGIDFALLVVAADDGVMPQTVEHLQILGALGFRRGLVALTKIDRVTGARVAQVRAAIEDLLAGTSLAGVPIHGVSAAEGTGMPELAAAIVAARQLRRDDGLHGFRLSIDRSFSVAGAGTVVTGTVTAGRAAVGDSLILSPEGREVRIRGMQRAGETVDAIASGARCALNLSGIARTEAHRGDWLVAPGLHAPSQKIDALVSLLGAPLRHDSRVHFHHGAANIGARVLAAGQRALPAGGQGLVRLVLDAPTSAVTGERFVLRDQSGTVLLGGGQVLDPLPPTRRRMLAEREARGKALTLADPAARLAALAGMPGNEPDLGWFAAACNLLPEAIEHMLAGNSIVCAGKSSALAITAERIEGLCAALLERVGAHHAAHPQEGGLNRRTARAAMPEPVSTDLFDSLLRRLIAEGRIAADGTLLRLPGHAVHFSELEAAFWRKARAVLDDAPPRPLVPGELARELCMGEAAVSAMLLRRKASGDVWQVAHGKYMTRDHVARLADLAARLDAASAAGFTAAGFRDASGLGRNFVIQLLEFFDRIGVTRRSGEARRMRGDWQAVVT